MDRNLRARRGQRQRQRPQRRQPIPSNANPLRPPFPRPPQRPFPSVPAPARPRPLEPPFAAAPPPSSLLLLILPFLHFLLLPLVPPLPENEQERARASARAAPPSLRYASCALSCHIPDPAHCPANVWISLSATGRQKSANSLGYHRRVRYFPSPHPSPGLHEKLWGPKESSKREARRSERTFRAPSPKKPPGGPQDTPRGYQEASHLLPRTSRDTPARPPEASTRTLTHKPFPWSFDRCPLSVNVDMSPVSPGAWRTK